MIDMAVVSTLDHPNWFEAADTRPMRSWRIYAPAIIEVSGVVASFDGALFARQNVQALVASYCSETSSPYLEGLSALSERIAKGLPYPLSSESSELAAAAIRANSEDRTPVRDWAKSLAASVFKH